MKKITLTAEYDGERISDVLLREGINFELPCAGNHTCGKCKIKVSGALNEISPSEAVMLSDSDMAEGMRMACFARARGEFIISLPEQKDYQILAKGVGALRVGSPMMSRGAYGVAIDIGTTTVTCTLYDTEARALSSVSELNRQQRFGADVISRINQGILHGNEDIHHTIITQLEDLLLLLSTQAEVPREAITHAVVTGNTTMLHFFSGLDPKGMGFVPFTPQSLFDIERNDLLKDIIAYLPPCVSAYVGADLVCCVLMSGMTDRNDTSLIVDMGTNGEMALFHEGILYSCSTAVGPAFEGAGISHGMVAASGAIAHTYYVPDLSTIRYETIANVPPEGICGSGVIDTVALLLEQNALLPSGLFVENGHPLSSLIHLQKEGPALLFPNSSVLVTQADIRQIQLAKAAVYAGAVTIAQICNVNLETLDVLYLCGGFGSFLNLTSAETIGLIPRNSKDRTVVLGNGAITGATMLLLDQAYQEKVVSLASQCRYIDLSSHEDFMDNYVNSMMFPGYGSKEE